MLSKSYQDEFVLILTNCSFLVDTATRLRQTDNKAEYLITKQRINQLRNKIKSGEELTPADFAGFGAFAAIQLLDVESKIKKMEALRDHLTQDIIPTLEPLQDMDEGTAEEYCRMIFTENFIEKGETEQ